MRILSDKQLVFCSTAVLLLSCIAVIIFNNNLFFLLTLLPFGFYYSINKTATLFWLMIMALPLSTELAITSTLGLDFPDEPLLILLTGLFFLKIVYKPKLLPQQMVQQPLFLLLVLHLLWIVVSCVYSTNSVISFKYLAAKLWYVIPFVILPFTVLTNERNIKRFALLLLLPMLFVAVQCIIRHSEYGFSFEGIKKHYLPFS